MRNPRINVTLSPSDIGVMELICVKKHMSMSALAKKIIEDWLEEYEDMLLARRAEEAEKRWLIGGSKTISHEELCQKLNIESNIQKMQQETLKNSQKTSKKESSVRSKRGSVFHRKKLENR